ncbi:UDP-N-acetyl-D-mannosamine dehydrogenase [Yunchengibacter salinarum]|uniref:UDP-N-acetyl-D-mannosamine dehydrogenase n=1 Tax=Yunchengibacter salinarum TaxID=3133399 RepID=UPI0035B60439
MNNKFRKVSVIGLGYIGLPTAAIIASKGIEVVGVDVNQNVVDQLNEGQAHIFEPDLDGLVNSTVKNGYLRAIAEPEASDAFLIAVPTPLSEGNAPDLSYVDAAADSIAPVLKSGDLIILESTSPVGTIERLTQNLAGVRPDLVFPISGCEEADVLMAYCPERIIPGKMITELVENDRIIGGMSQSSREAAMELYATFVRGNLVPTTGRVAEMVKLAENAYRDVNIAFANELSKICEYLEVDVWDVIELANHHPRVDILKPGPGVGGHCIAVDPWFIIDAAKDRSLLMRAARQVNDTKPDYVVEQVKRLAQPGEAIACLGLAYKPDTDDLRESPAITVVEKMDAAGLGPLHVVEPNIHAMPDVLNGKGLIYQNLESALEQADVVVLLVDHRQFKEIDVSCFGDKRVYDTRGIWPRY